jgi:hypothetical protein
MTTTLIHEELSSIELAGLAELSLCPVRISYSLDVHVTTHNHETVTTSTPIQCETCGVTIPAEDMLYHDCEDPQPDWRLNASWSDVPYGLDRALSHVGADVSDPDVDDWCGEYITEQVSLFGDACTPEELAYVEAFYDQYGGASEVPTCATMGILSADGVAPAMSVEHIDEGWDPMPAFAGSLYISDPRLFLEIQ